MSIERMKELTESIIQLTNERRVLGRSLPPVTLDTVKGDPFFEAHVREWMRSWMPTIDTTLLDRDDYEKWELLATRYEVRDWEDEEGGVLYGVFDTVDDVLLDGTAYDESDMREKADDLEREWRDSFCAFPFAWNTGWVLENMAWLDELTAAGFLVYEYDRDIIIAGIDGGGYSFMDQHFIPLYAGLAEKNEWLVETRDGPRLITMVG